jgi:hypothetical protein
MIVFMPFPDFERSAKALSIKHLYQVEVAGLLILKSLCECYPKRANGESGYSYHTMAKFWTNAELQLARFIATTSEERIIRPIKVSGKTEMLKKRKEALFKWRDIVSKLEEAEYPEIDPPFWGDEEFHSGLRALLLYKGCKIATHKKWKNAEYPDHACTRNLLPSRTSWTRENYQAIWEFFGQPESDWYEQFGWSEEPDDTKYFYRLDRTPTMAHEIERKLLRPYNPVLKPRT